VNLHYIPVHLQPYYRRLGFHAGQFPEAEEYYREAITLPLFAAMTDEKQECVIEAVGNII
jgi:dTDP-4-amino-4,6-dideoxygalactose transaminase